MTSLSPQQPAESRGGWSRADIFCLAVLLVLVALISWQRLTFDDWVARHDLMTFFVPWYAFLGDRLRDFDIPGWNPYLLSGTPFAGDPESGWMYLPAMILTPLFSVVTVFKALVPVHLVIAGLSMYAFTRVLGMRAVASLVASVAFVAGPLVQWTTYCCTIFSQFSTWIPLALLGVELALRAQDWRSRVLPWFVTGFALSQMFAGWIGEGWMLAVITVGGYTLYRAVLSPPHPGGDLKTRFSLAVATGTATIVSGLALGAAGILIRIDVNAETQLAGGSYDNVSRGGRLNPPWGVDELFLRLIGSGYQNRSTTLGGAVIVLALLAPFVARRRYAVPFFCVLTVVPLILALEPTPLHDLIYLIPSFQDFHEHDPWRVYSVARIGRAILCGALLNDRPRMRGQRHFWPVVVFPLLAMVLVVAILNLDGDFVGWQPLIAAGLATVALVIAVVWPVKLSARSQRHSLSIGLVAIMLAAIVLQPTATELTGSWFGWPADESWESHWNPNPIIAKGLTLDTSSTDPGGAGEFLQQQDETEDPFRYVGYAGYRYPNAPRSGDALTFRRFEPTIQSLLVNARPVFLKLQEIQGYNPSQLDRYVDFFTALNGRPQNYHFEYLEPGGVQSPLLDLLNVRYFLVPRDLPVNREDVVALTGHKPIVFQNEYVTVYENLDAYPRAWIVHDVRQAPKDEILPQITSGAINPRQTALVEETPPFVEATTSSAADQARVVQLEPDAISVATRTDAAGFLVLSEVYDPGWRAYIDGEQVDILTTNFVLRGIPIPAGEHTVELRYEPRSLQIGLAITGFAIIAMLAAVIFAAWPVMKRVMVRRATLTEPSTAGQQRDLAEGGRGEKRPMGGMAE